jgi:hypothetical protein
MHIRESLLRARPFRDLLVHLADSPAGEIASFSFLFRDDPLFKLARIYSETLLLCKTVAHWFGFKLPADNQQG